MAKTVHRPLSPREIIRIVHQEPWTRIVHHSHNSALSRTPEAIQSRTPEAIQNRTPEAIQSRTPEAIQNPTPTLVPREASQEVEFVSKPVFL